MFPIQNRTTSINGETAGYLLISRAQGASPGWSGYPLYGAVAGLPTVPRATCRPAKPLRGRTLVPNREPVYTRDLRCTRANELATGRLPRSELGTHFNRGLRDAASPRFPPIFDRAS